jgi:hypothetical protein
MIRAILLSMLVISPVAFCGQPKTPFVPDSQYVYMPIKDMEPDTTEKANALGLDVMIGNSGFGGGFFYKQRITETISWTASLSISEAKAPNEIAYYDPYTGQKYVPGKVNQLWVVPAMLGLQYRLFSDEITDTFRPYVFGGVGPDLVFAAPYDQPLSYSFSHGRSYFGGGAYIGLGAYFGSDPGSLLGVSIRYYILPLRHGVESMQGEPMANFNTFFIAFNIGTQY